MPALGDKPIDLIDVAAVLEGNPRATWFKSVGPEKAELVGNVMGSRKRLAIALDTDEAGLLAAIMQRLSQPMKPVKVERAMVFKLCIALAALALLLFIIVRAAL